MREGGRRRFGPRRIERGGARERLRLNTEDTENGKGREHGEFVERREDRESWRSAAKGGLGGVMSKKPGRFARAIVLGLDEGSREKAARAVGRRKAFFFPALTDRANLCRPSGAGTL